MKRPKGEPPRNMAASVKTRLMSLSRERKEDLSMLEPSEGIARLERALRMDEILAANEPAYVSAELAQMAGRYGLLIARWWVH